MARDYLSIIYAEFLEHTDATRVANADAVKIYQDGKDCNIALIESGVENLVAKLNNADSLEMLKAVCAYGSDIIPLKYGYCVEY